MTCHYYSRLCPGGDSSRHGETMTVNLWEIVLIYLVDFK